MRDPVRNLRVVVIAVAMGCGLVACGGDGGGDAADDDAPEVVDATLEAAFAESVTLPFGLEVLDGTTPIGRPGVYDHEPYSINGVAVEARTLRAAYRVTADDPVAVFREWAGQLDGLALDGLSMTSGAEPDDPWMSAFAIGDDSAVFELWATGADPILLVSLDRTSDAPPTVPALQDDAGEPAAPRSVLDGAGRVAGEELFTEQGQVVHLPEGTRALTPLIPTRGGTGNSTTVLAADDGEAAVHDLLDEARSVNEHGEVGAPVVDEVEGVTVVHGGFNVPAGGWGFRVVSVHGPDDPFATVYVSSFAD